MKMNVSSIRRHMLATAAMLMTGSVSIAVAETATSPITLVVPATPGGSNDIVARILAPLLNAELDRPIVVDNRAGAGGNLGAAMVARSEPESGQYLLTAASVVTINPGLFKNPGFDILRDFVAIGGVATVPHVLLVNKNLPVSTVPELLALLRSEPGKYFFGSAGNGSYSHVLMEFMKRAEKVDVAHVPFKGVAPAMTELMAGRIQMLISTLPSAMPYMGSNDVKAIAVLSQERSEFVPNLPTAQETVPGMVGDLWIAMYAPRKTPAADVARMKSALHKAKSSADLKEKFRKLGAVTFDLSADALQRQTATDLSKWSALIRSSGIQVD